MVQIRSARDDLMGLDVSHGKMEVDNPVNLWGTVEEPAWSWAYVLGADGTIGPAKLPHVPAACTRLCLGIEAREAGAATGSKVVLVDRSDAQRRIIFLGRVARLGATAAAKAAKAEAALPPALPGTSHRLLLLKSPACPWLGAGQMAIVASGATYTGAFEHSGRTLHGRGTQLRVGTSAAGVCWVVGVPTGSTGAGWIACSARCTTHAHGTGARAPCCVAGCWMSWWMSCRMGW